MIHISNREEINSFLHKGKNTAFSNEEDARRYVRENLKNAYPEHDPRDINFFELFMSSKHTKRYLILFAAAFVIVMLFYIFILRNLKATINIEIIEKQTIPMYLYIIAYHLIFFLLFLLYAAKSAMKNYTLLTSGKTAVGVIKQIYCITPYRRSSFNRYVVVYLFPLDTGNIGKNEFYLETLPDDIQVGTIGSVKYFDSENSLWIGKDWHQYM